MIPEHHILLKLFPGIEIPLVMGILNVTPDSFSDGQQYLALENAVIRAKEMLQQGADIIDIGGESTRPGAKPVSAEEEIERIKPVIETIRSGSNAIISIDTRKGAVALAAIKSGANIVNDVSGLEYDPLMAEVLADYPDTGIILMHAQGIPETMQMNPYYEDVIEELKEYFYERLLYCSRMGISDTRICIDPGIGFGKNLEHNLMILAHLKELHSLGLPIVLGASRKRFIDAITPAFTDERLGGSIAATTMALEQWVEVIRVHDVQEHFQYLKVMQAIRQRA